MNLQTYYSRIREIEESLGNEAVVIRSVATEAGGMAGRLTEVSPSLAARTVVDGLAELATKEEAERHRSEGIAKRRAEEEKRRAAEVQFTVISESDLRALSRRGRGTKE